MLRAFFLVLVSVLLPGLASAQDSPPGHPWAGTYEGYPVTGSRKLKVEVTPLDEPSEFPGLTPFRVDFYMEGVIEDTYTGYADDISLWVGEVTYDETGQAQIDTVLYLEQLPDEAENFGTWALYPPDVPVPEWGNYTYTPFP